MRALMAALMVLSGLAGYGCTPSATTPPVAGAAAAAGAMPAGAGAEGQPAASEGEASAISSGTVSAPSVAPLGYHMEGDQVVFEFVPSRFHMATNAHTGRSAALTDLDIGSAAVAGAFNAWSVDAWSMERVATGFRLRRSRSTFGETASVPFKFVVNGEWWVEPPGDAPNRADSGPDNHSSNLILTLR